MNKKCITLGVQELFARRFNTAAGLQWWPAFIVVPQNLT